jgi:hypothetical protein
MTSLTTLSTLGAELSGEQLNDVDGGFVMLVILGLAAFDAGLWTYIATR